MIRRAASHDYLRLAAIHAQGFEHPWDVRTLMDLSERPYHSLYCLEDAAEIVGFVMLADVAGEAEILTLVTDPAHRGRGCARRLLNGVFAQLEADTVFLEVAVDNEAALGLYRGLGFTPSGKRKAYYARDNAPPVDALILRLALKGA